MEVHGCVCSGDGRVCRGEVCVWDRDAGEGGGERDGTDGDVRESWK